MSMQFIDLKTQYKELKSSIDERIQGVLDHGQYILGPEVQQCEKALSEFTGAPFALTCSNGTDAAIMALMALEIGPGDEVIIPGFSFIATAETVVLVGATPVFVDIERDTFNIDASKIESAITSKTKAIMPVSLYGQPADMDEINSIAKKNNLFVIEDAAQAFGSTYKDKTSCNLSPIACTSFFPAKPLGCYGDGGAIFTDNEELHERLISIRMHGQEKTERYKHKMIGTNGRMDTLQCAILLTKLEKFPWEVERRHHIGTRYTHLFKELQDADKLKTPVVRDDRDSVFAQYTLHLGDHERRIQTIEGLKTQGIPTAVHYPVPMYKHSPYQRYFQGEDLPNSLWASQGVMSLPMHPYLTESDQDRVVQAVFEVLS